ncbi:hypothetical protein JL720_9861 [Aureococcus anophagefferens]|nr:hypothetical protein JL720_9861 [Aureococcus anophagefferens]
MRAHLTSCLKKPFDPERLDSLDFDPNTATRDTREECGTGPTASFGDRVTYLHAACRDNDAQLVQYLIKRNADVNRETPGYTPLHVACRNGYLDIVRCLLAAGAKVDAEAFCIDGQLGTPLDVACRHGHCGIAELLLGHEPAVDVVKDDLVVACREGHVAVAELLLAYIARVEPAAVNLWIDLLDAAPPRHRASPNSSSVMNLRSMW